MIHRLFRTCRPSKRRQVIASLVPRHQCSHLRCSQAATFAHHRISMGFAAYPSRFAGVQAAFPAAFAPCKSMAAPISSTAWLLVPASRSKLPIAPRPGLQQILLIVLGTSQISCSPCCLGSKANWPLCNTHRRHCPTVELPIIDQAGKTILSSSFSISSEITDSACWVCLFLTSLHFATSSRSTLVWTSCLGWTPPNRPSRRPRHDFPLFRHCHLLLKCPKNSMQHCGGGSSDRW